GFIRREYNHNVTGERWSLRKMGWLSRHTYLGKVIYSLYGGPRMPAKEGNEKIFRYLPASVNPEDTVWAEAFDEIKSIKKWAEDRKLPLVFVIFPTTAQIEYPDTISRKPQDILDKFLDEEGLLYIDPYKEFLDYRAKTGESPFVDTSTHPNPRALALIADQMVDMSLSKGLIINNIPEPGTIDIGTVNDNDYISYGWDKPEKSPEGINYRWAVNGDTKILIPAMKKSESVLSIRLKPFFPEYNNKMLTVELYLNDKSVGSHILKEDWQTVTFKLDGLKTDNYNNLLFRFNYAISPGDLKMSNDIRELTAMVDWIKFN
ncbi:MAG: hypothetical protein JW737_08855, partial [Acidobacteria bacterium]|nr:hypothetical protein [Acidobacteriota bacterium]